MKKMGIRRNSKWVLGLWICFLILLPGCSFFSQTGAPEIVAEPERFQRAVKIGVILPLSGKSATIGKSMRDAIRIAVRDWNNRDALQGTQVLLVEKDSSNEEKRAAEAARVLSADPEICAILGDLGNATSLAAGSIAIQTRIPLLSPTAAGTRLAAAGDWAFGLAPDPAQQVDVLGRFLSAGAHQAPVALLSSQEPAMAPLRDLWQKTASAQGWRIVSDEILAESDKNVAPLVARWREAGAAGAVLATGDRTVQTITQLRAAGWSKPIAAAGWLPKNLGRQTEVFHDVWFATTFSYARKAPEVASFAEQFKKQTQLEPTIEAALATDAARLLLAALAGLPDAQRLDRIQVRNALVKQRLNGLSGLLGFDADGNPLPRVLVARLEEGRTVIIQDYSMNP